MTNRTMTTLQKPTPESTFNPTLSMVCNAVATDTTDTTLQTVLDDIRNGTYADRIHAIRAEKNEDQRRELKKKLPGIMFAGQFSKRKSDQLKTPSHLIVIDVDSIDDAPAIRKSMAGDHHIRAAFLSPSGNGIKVILPTGGMDHQTAFHSAERYLSDHYGITCDPSGKDVARLCFVSTDMALVENITATAPPIAEATVEAVPHAHGKINGKLLNHKYESVSADEIRQALRCIPARPPYQDWLKISSAVWSELGMAEGCHVLNEWSPEEHPGEYAEKYRHRLDQVSVSTLFYYARQHGYTPERKGTTQTIETNDTVDPESLFVDLGPILDGDIKREVPAVGNIEDGCCLLYRGRVNEIHGEPGHGKSNVAIGTCAQMLNTGGTVYYIDPEDNPIAIVGRLLTFGADKGAVRDRFKYLHNPECREIQLAIKHAEADHPDLVVIDGLAELMAGAGASENDASEVLQFFRWAIRPFAEIGAAVLVSDHVVKDREGRGRWARGSGAKMGRYDGAVYSLKVKQPYGPEQAGSVRLIVAKDRNGGVGAVGTCAADVHFTPGEDGQTIVKIVKPEDGGSFRPTTLMARISDHIHTHPDTTRRDLRDLGKSQYIDAAIGELEKDGCLKVFRQGPGKPNIYQLLKEFKV